MAVKLRCGGPGNRVAQYVCTYLYFVHLLLDILVHGDIVSQERPLGARSGPMSARPTPVGGKASRPEGCSGGRPWVGLEAPRRFKPS